MKIFNFQIIVQEETFEPGVTEFNEVIIGSPVNGIIEGIHFMAELSGKVLEIIQLVDEHIIYLVPEGCTSKEDFILVFQHNAYDGMFNELNLYFNAEDANTLTNLWLIEIKPEFAHFMSAQTRLITT